jgi:superfamily II DNA helicase RecQ
MRAKLLTLRFSPQLGRFDDAALIALQQKVVLEHVREHLVQVGGEAMLVCVAVWREKAEACGTAAATSASPKLSAVPPNPEASVFPPATAAQDAPDVRRGPATPVGERRADFTAEQQTLFDLLRRWRRQKAHDEGAPPYVVLTNRQLIDLVLQRPRSKKAMGQIAGFGDKKLARHGEELLTLLWPDAPPSARPEAPAVPVTTTAEAAS